MTGNGTYSGFTFQPEDDWDPPSFEDFPYDHTWFLWRGPVTQAVSAGNWRTFPHLQHFESFSRVMLPRVQEFQALLQLHGVRPDILECGVCRQAGLVGRQMTACFAQDVAAGGGRHHLQRLWSVALSVGPGLWEEAHVAGGAIRYNYVDGVIEICRGEPPKVDEIAPASSSPLVDQRRRTSRRCSGSRDAVSSPRQGNLAAGSGLAAAVVANLAAELAAASLDSPLPGESSRCREELLNSSINTDCLSSKTLEAVAELLEDPIGWDSELEDRVVLHERPIGLEIGPVADGRGAVVQETGRSAAAAGVEVGSQILSINDNNVEDMLTNEIQGMLEKERLPITLDLKPPLNLPSIGQRKKRKRDPIVVCTQNCRGSYRIVTDAIEQLGWTEVATDLTSPASVVWLEHSDAVDGIAPVQTVSRIEAFLQFCKKARLAKSLNAWVVEEPEDFAFSPRTWVLPYDAADLKASMSKCRTATYIAKPTAGAQGKGILLARKWKDLEAVVQKCKDSLCRPTPTEYAVQQYIAQPLLLDGLKFDMRLFAVVTSVVPLRAYLFKEGLARFCTVPYEAPCDQNLRTACMHLTNFALNKKSVDFHSSEGLAHHDEGSKRSVSAALFQIEEAYGVSPDSIWEKISRLVANTLVALRPGLVEYYVHEVHRPLHPLGPKSFQILGMDILIDHDFEPRLLELNANPSLSATQPASEIVAEAFEDQLPEIAQARATSSTADPRLGSTASSIAGGGTGLSIRPRSNSGHTSSTSTHERRRHSSGRQRSTAGGSSPAISRPRSGMLPTASPPRNSTLSRSRSDTNTTSPSLPRSSPLPRGSTSPSTQASRRSGTHGSARLRRAMQRSRSRLSTGEQPQPEPGMVMSELDLEIKRELVSQALLLARPAPRFKTARLKRQWVPRDGTDFIPLDDNGQWSLPGQPSRAEATRLDAPDRSPAFKALDFEELASPRVLEYAQAHLQLYRWWVKSCGQGKNSLGQEKVMRLLERKGFVGSAVKCLFPDRVTAQLWLSKLWREMTEGNFGLNVPQFIDFAGRIGCMLLGMDDPEDLSHISGILEYVAQGLCSD